MTHAELYTEWLMSREDGQTFEQWLITVIEAQNETIAELVVANQKIVSHAGNMALAAQMSHNQVVDLYDDIDALNAEIVSLNNQLRAIRLWAMNGHLDRIKSSLSKPNDEPKGA